MRERYTVRSFNMNEKTEDIMERKVVEDNRDRNIYENLTHVYVHIYIYVCICINCSCSCYYNKNIFSRIMS